MMKAGSSDAWTLGIGASLLCAGFVIWQLRSAGEDRVAADLIQALPAAMVQPGAPSVAVVTAAIAGDTRLALSVRSPARITWEVDVPPAARLELSAGLDERRWPRSSAGIRFLAGVSHLGKYEALASIDMNPFADSADRRWRHVSVDLSPYAGQSVRVICSVYPLSAGPAEPERDTALIGAPRVMVR